MNNNLPHSNYSSPSPSRAAGIHHISPHFSNDANERRVRRTSYDNSPAPSSHFVQHHDLRGQSAMAYSDNYAHPPRAPAPQHYQTHNPSAPNWANPGGGKDWRGMPYPQGQVLPQQQARYDQDDEMEDDWRITYAPELDSECQDALEQFLLESNQFDFVESGSMSPEAWHAFDSPPSPMQAQAAPKPQVPLWENFVKLDTPRTIPPEEMPTPGSTISILCDDGGQPTSCFYQVENVSNTLVQLKYGYTTTHVDLRSVKEFSVMGRAPTLTETTTETKEDTRSSTVRISREKPAEYVFPEVGCGIRLETSQNVWKDLSVMSVVDDVVEGRDADTGEILGIKMMWNYNWEYSYKNPTWSGNGCKIEESLLADGALIDCRDTFVQCLVYAMNNSILTYDVLMLVTGRAIRFEWLSGLSDDETFEDYDQYAVSKERLKKSDYDVLKVILDVTGYAFNAFNVNEFSAIKYHVCDWIDHEKVVICFSEDGLVAICDYDEDKTFVKCVNREHVALEKLRGPFVILEQLGQQLKTFELRDRYQAFPVSFVEKMLKAALTELNASESDIFHQIVEVDDEKDEDTATLIKKGVIHVGRNGLKKFAADLKVKKDDDEKFAEAATLALRCFYNSLGILLRGLNAVTSFSSPSCEHYTQEYKNSLTQIRKDFNNIVKSFERLIRKSSGIRVVGEDSQMTDFVFDGFWTKQEFSEWFDEYLTSHANLLTTHLEESLSVVVQQREVMGGLSDSSNAEPVW